MQGVSGWSVWHILALFVVLVIAAALATVLILVLRATKEVPPVSWGTKPTRDKARLREIDEQLAQGRISDAEHAAKRAEIDSS